MFDNDLYRTHKAKVGGNCNQESTLCSNTINKSSKRSNSFFDDIFNLNDDDSVNQSRPSNKYVSEEWFEKLSKQDNSDSQVLNQESYKNKANTFPMWVEDPKEDNSSLE